MSQEGYSLFTEDEMYHLSGNQPEGEGYEEEYYMEPQPSKKTEPVKASNTLRYVLIGVGSLLGLLLLWWLFSRFSAPAAPATPVQPMTPSIGSQGAQGAQGLQGPQGPQGAGPSFPSGTLPTTVELPSPGATASPKDILSALAKKASHPSGEPFNTHEQFVIQTYSANPDIAYLVWAPPKPDQAVAAGTTYVAKNTAASSARAFALVFDGTQWDIREIDPYF